MLKEKCPWSENQTMFLGRELIGYDIDELGDGMSLVGYLIPVVEEHILAYQYRIW